MNWGFVIAWLEVFPDCTTEDVTFMGTMIAGMVA